MSSRGMLSRWLDAIRSPQRWSSMSGLEDTSGSPHGRSQLSPASTPTGNSGPWRCPCGHQPSGAWPAQAWWTDSWPLMALRRHLIRKAQLKASVDAGGRDDSRQGGRAAGGKGRSAGPCLLLLLPLRCHEPKCHSESRPALPVTGWSRAGAARKLWRGWLRGCRLGSPGGVSRACLAAETSSGVLAATLTQASPQAQSALPQAVAPGFRERPPARARQTRGACDNPAQKSNLTTAPVFAGQCCHNLIRDTPQGMWGDRHCCVPPEKAVCDPSVSEPFLHCSPEHSYSEQGSPMGLITGQAQM